MFIIFSFIVFIFVIIFLFNNYQKQKNEIEELKKREKEKENRRKERFELFEKNIKEKYEQLKILINLMKNKYIKFYSLDFYLNDFKVVKYNKEREQLKEELNNFYEYKEFIQDYDVYNDKLNSIILLEKDIIELNKKYVKKELEFNKDFFSNIDGKSLDEQQRKSVVIDEDNNLIIAGAGSGKTLTISGKVKYLVERKKIKPEEILLLTFTRSAANEMTERIKEKLKINIEASTFHSLGNKISGNFEDNKYDVLTSPYKYINEKSIIKLLLRNKETSEALIDYITYYAKDNITEIDDNFKNKSEYYDLIDKPIPLSESLNEILYNSLINFKALYIYENK